MRLCVLMCALLLAGCSRESDEKVVTVVNEQLLLLATIIGAVAALPTLIDFLVDRRKRRERIALSLEDEPVASLKPRLAGMDDLLADIADLIDRARHPSEYARLEAGNELLIVGPNLSGKKTLAQVIARQAEIQRLITVYNPRNVDALAKAKSLIARERGTKIMLLLPRIDLAFEKEDEEVLTELEALIETTSEQANVLVIGTATTLQPNGPIDNLFGIKLVLPGAGRTEPVNESQDAAMRHVLADVASFYLNEAQQQGFVLEGITQEAFIARILEVSTNPAEVQDIVTIAQTAAIYRRRAGNSASPGMTHEMLEKAISRVVVRIVAAET